jgi:predicted O-linked N-acetylglucosamine transferase (SPINDLY family)
VCDNCSHNSNGQSHDSNFLNLPKFNLQVFDEKYENWVSFLHLFQSTIHHNQSLSDVQKFFYLKSYLKGEPLNLLSTLPLSQSNYNVAIELLKDRYANQKKIVNTHLKALFSLPQVN